MALSATELHNLKTLFEWNKKADAIGSKAFCLVGANEDGFIQIFSDFDHKLLALELRKVIGIIESGKEIIKIEN